MACCSRRVLDVFVHWTLMLFGLTKLLLDLPCWYFILNEQHKMFILKNTTVDESAMDKLFYGMNVAMLKFVVDVFIDCVLLYACYKKNKGLLLLCTSYNGFFGGLMIAAMSRVFRNFFKSVVKNVVRYSVTGHTDMSDSAVELYLFFVFVVPYMCSSIHIDSSQIIAIFITYFLLTHLVLPFLLYMEIKMVTRFRLENRAILMHLLERKMEETVPMTAQNSDV